MTTKLVALMLVEQGVNKTQFPTTRLNWAS